jgi:hypothetical protein
VRLTTKRQGCIKGMWCCQIEGSARGSSDASGDWCLQVGRQHQGSWPLRATSPSTMGTLGTCINEVSVG